MAISRHGSVPVPAQEQADWAATMGTWKIGGRDSQDGVRRPPNGDTKQLCQVDPVTGKHCVGLFSVGGAGWRDQRLKVGPKSTQHQRAIAVRESDVRNGGIGGEDATFAMSTNHRNATASVSPTLWYINAPHPTDRYAEKMRRLRPKDVLPRRVKIERENAAQQQLKQHTEKLGCTGLPLHEARDLVIEMLYANLEASWMKLQKSSSNKAGGGVSEAEFESILVDSQWVCHEHMLALMRTYACDAGIDAAMVVADMWQCIQRPGFSEARFPAAMLVVVSTLIDRLRNLESRFLESDEAARQKNGSVVARTENERPAGHLDQEVVAHDLEACGFTVAGGLVSRLHLLYCSHTGQWMGYLDYQRFLKDLRYTGK